MKPKYMLDTNICIYLMKHQPAEVKARFDQCFVGEVVISAITLAELEYGVLLLVQPKPPIGRNSQVLLKMFLSYPLTPWPPGPMAPPGLPVANAVGTHWTS